jgi:DNA-binding NarL/FixJ family response regulator
MSPEIARMVIDKFNHTGKIDPVNNLTPKEKQVIGCLEEGLSYKMIGEKLQISVDTVRFHIKNIYRKLHVNSKTDLIKKSLRGEI